MARPTLSELSCFVAVATHKNFRMAADSLGVTRSNLSHAVRALEERMGVQLLRRTTRSVAMTDVGEHLLESLRPVLDDLDRALDQVEHFRERPCGVLRISAPIESVRELLEVVVPEFRRRHPEVELELDSNGKFVDIVASGFDAGVRLRRAYPTT